jgi:excisionase family DNA binding protein
VVFCYWHAQNPTPIFLKIMQENILSKLDAIEQRLVEQNLLQKEIINFAEACLYLDLSSSHLYKLTSANAVPCYCPQGKKLYFRRAELDLWLTSRRNASASEVEQKAANYITKRGRAKR